MRIMKRISIIATAGALAMVAGCASTESQKSTGEYIDDAAITAKVETALIRDDSLDAIDINIETYKGVVQLSGFVDSREDVREAEEVARNVNGVVDVENDLRVKAGD
ncbi:MAG TPA: BON domain-containing protein [Gammaproteobacteria bacterium]